MCGIAAFVFNQSADFGIVEHAMQRMISVMHRRGPDAERVWAGEGIILGHRRLAILDLDVRATQPMISSDGRYSIVFNGEIYNFRSLKKSLEAQGLRFRTTSDTEVILEMFARVGESMLAKLRGMYAFSIWDAQEKKLFIARDPYGIKPLYIAKSSYGTIVASQVKALLTSGLVSRDPDASGQAGFWLLGSVPEPFTWFRDISMLRAGCCAWIDEHGCSEPKSFWNVGESWHERPIKLSSHDMYEKVRNSLLDSVRAHLVADVPVGVFLSGGIDSGSIAGLMVEAGCNNLHGVTLVYDEFNGKKSDEGPTASLIASHYGIKNSLRRVTSFEFKNDLPRILDAMDQPCVDGINTWYASKAIAELKLKVVVSGVGGDELFQGYSSFRHIPLVVRLWSYLAAVPGMKSMVGIFANWQALHKQNPRWRMLPNLADTVAGVWFLRRGLFAPEELPDLMGKELANEAMRSFSAVGMVHDMVGSLPKNARLALGQTESMTYLRNQLLRDSDWASMDHSVELRTPLVDAWLLRELSPYMSDFQNFPGKRLLAMSPVKPLPQDIRARRKTGFGVPIGRWLEEVGCPYCYAGASKSLARHIATVYNSCHGLD